jgi:hypothetical protein
MLERRVKFFLNHLQALRLLCMGRRAIFPPFDRFNQRRKYMQDENLTVRFAQAFLAIVATSASVFLVQFALLTG